ncbi:MAG TPA: hypothetical protein VGF28_14250 [Thermoanaerobaculia bacterium]|jgi:hypothetical protein
MINDAVVARQVIDVALRVSSELDHSVHLLLDGSVGGAELTDYKRAVGHVMVEIYDRILNPLFRMHPQLVPEEWRTWYPSPGGA